MARRGVDRLRVTRGRTVAPAIVGCAEMRAALEHLARNPALRIARIVARVFEATARIFGNAARLRRIGFVLRRIPVGGPLPYVPNHVMEAVAVRRKCRYRGGTFEAIGRKIL